MLLSGSRSIICLDDASIFLLPYKREESNALLAFPIYVCVYIKNPLCVSGCCLLAGM